MGVRGPVVEIAEKNLMDEIAERIQKINPAEKIAAAKKGYWKHRKSVDLPATHQNITRMFVPTVEATADILDANGKILVAKGTKVNPLTKMPFTRSIIVYNPNRHGERALAEKLMLDAQKRGKQPVMIITKPLENSFNSVFDEQAKLGGVPIYFLSHALASRMQITHTVSVVESEHLHFIVREYKNTN